MSPSDLLPRRVAPGLTRASIAIALLAVASPLTAQIGRTVPPAGADTLQAPITDRYRATGLKRWILGAGYRDVWGDTIPIPVLDIPGTAGGLTPVETGGYGQTMSLEFLGDDGLEYAVRSIDKDPTRRLDSLFLGTIVARVVQNQVGQFLPTAGLVVDPLLEATGIRHPKHRLVVIPNVPELGEYGEFAGLIGMFTDRPQEGQDDTRGFANSDRIVGTDRLLEEIERGRCDRVDARGYLKARLMDIVVGDRDRHGGQWRWARYPVGEDCSRWEVIPEDRDQAFVRNDGFMMTLYRLVRPQQVEFGPEYPDIAGLTFNGWELDRAFLVPLDFDVWEEVVAEIQTELTDEVIVDAVQRLPAPHYARVGNFVAGSLMSRRDDLMKAATPFYRMISAEPDIVATDGDEQAIIEHLPDGFVRVTIAFRDGDDVEAPYYDRTFDPDVTSEIRVVMKGGDDRINVRGGDGGMTIRVVGGGGDDLFVNESETGAGRTRYYDARGDNDVVGEVVVDERRHERPPATNLAHQFALDWGGARRTLPQLGYDPDLGLRLGMTTSRQRYGFRKDPVRSEQTFHLAVASGGPDLIGGWAGRFRDAALGADLVFDAHYSGLEVLRYYGLGAATVQASNSDFYEVTRRHVRLSTGLEWAWGLTGRDSEQEIDQREFRPVLRMGLAGVAQFSSTPLAENSDQFIGLLANPPLGLGDFGQLGMAGWFEVDTRNASAYPTSGMRLRADASAYPEVWDATGPFGTAGGTLSAFLTPTGSRRAPTLALRGGAHGVFGDFPYHESAFLGGVETLRGSREQRFAGEAALYGNAELRLPLAEFALLFPTEIGIHGVADAGRVFLENDPTGTDKWHTGFGGGIWFALLNRTQSFSISVVNGADLLGLYIRGGLHF